MTACHITFQYKLFFSHVILEKELGVAPLYHGLTQVLNKIKESPDTQYYNMKFLQSAILDTIVVP
jgi:hypothetical protein